MRVAESRLRVMGSGAHVVSVGSAPPLERHIHSYLNRLERLWSRYIPDSDVSRLNQAGGEPVKVAPETITLVEASLHAWRVTQGRFDPTVLGALVRAGDVRAQPDTRGTVTVTADLDPTKIGTCSDIVIDGRDMTVRLPRGAGFDPGGIGKGLAADLLVVELLESDGAGFMVSIGGDLRAEGEPPDGSSWSVVVEDPFDSDAAVATLHFEAGGVATSSTYGRRLPRGSSHVVDPSTGSPIDGPDVACTVLAGAAWLAEGVTKGALIAGIESGLRLIDEAQMAGLMISDGRVLGSDRVGAFL